MKLAINQTSKTAVRGVNARRLLLASLLAGTTLASTGCSGRGFSMASMNPFNRKETVTPDVGAKPGMTESIAAGAVGAGNKVKAMTVSARNAVTGVFSRDKAETSTEKLADNDPLRLDNKPDKVDPEVFVANGQLWESTGDLTKAMESYTKALESSPKHGPALASMARLHFRQNELPKAATQFQKAIEQSPNDAGLYNDLGLTLSKMGNHAGAVATLERALQLAPGTSRYANNLASVKFEAGDASAAMQVLAQNNKPAVAHFNMAYLHFKSGQMPQASAQLNEAIKFESQAASDPAVGRAVERSREMLAQIAAGGGGTVAQVAGQTTPPARPTATPTMSKAAATPSMSGAMAAITPPTSTTAQATTSQVTNSQVTRPQVTTPDAAPPSWTQAWNPNWQQTTPPAKPAAPAPAPTPATRPAPAPTGGFTLPQ